MSYLSVVERISSATARSGRRPEAVRLLAVTKGRSLAEIDALAAAGHRTFGESRVHEAIAKFARGREAGRGFTPRFPAELHLIGHLQRNKARLAAEVFDVIHSLDSEALTARLEGVLDEHAELGTGRSRIQVLVQVNTSGEPSKTGVHPAGLEPLLTRVAASARLELVGLMTMATGGLLAGDPSAARACFIMLRGLAERHRKLFASPDQVELSMGMSSDFEAAIEEGATLVRVGTALFEAARHERARAAGEL